MGFERVTKKLPVTSSVANFEVRLEKIAAQNESVTVTADVNCATLNRRGADAGVVNVERLPVAQRNLWQEGHRLWRQELQCRFR